MKTYTLILTSLLISGSIFALTPEAPQQNASLWDLAKQAYQYVTENPQMVDEFKKQFLNNPEQIKKFDDKASAFVAQKKNDFNIDQMEKSELNQKLQEQWKKSGTDKSYVAWLAANPSEILKAINS